MGEKTRRDEQKNEEKKRTKTTVMKEKRNVERKNGTKRD